MYNIPITPPEFKDVEGEVKRILSRCGVSEKDISYLPLTTEISCLLIAEAFRMWSKEWKEEKYEQT